MVITQFPSGNLYGDSTIQLVKVPDRAILDALRSGHAPRLGGHEIASLFMITASEDVGIEPVPNLAALATADLDGRRHIAICPAETPGSALSVHEDFVLVSIREVFWCRRCPISYSEKGDIDVQNRAPP